MPKETTKRLLIVDSDKYACNFAKFYFERRGYVVYTADSTIKAFKLLREENPQVLLLDIQVSSRSGIDLLVEIRKFNHDICVVMTGAEELDHKTHLLVTELDVLEFIEKPLIISELEKAIDRAWNEYNPPPATKQTSSGYGVGPPDCSEKGGPVL